MGCDIVWFVKRVALLAAVLVADGLLGGRLARASDDVRRGESAERLESRQAVPEQRRLVILADPQSGRLIRSVRRDRRQPNASAASSNQEIDGVEGAEQAVKAGSVNLDLLVREAAARYGVAPELIEAVIRLESAYNPYAVSSKGAKGLMQLMPATARRFGVKDIFDPAENVRGGVEYLRHLLDKYGGDERLTLAAFNAGEGAVERHSGVPPYSETRRYVESAMRRLRLAGDGTSNEDSGDSAQSRIVAQLAADGELRFEVRRE